MRTSYRTLQLWVCLFFWFFTASCNENEQAKPAVSTGSTLPVAPLNPAPAIGDPSFVLQKDTFSAKGPQGITRNVLQDKNGHYWFASWDGLIQYDGKRFTNFTLKAGLRHFHVFAVYEDRAGNLWIGMIGGGLYRYDGQSFRLFTTTDGLASNVVMSIFEDSFGNIWLGTDKGASRYDGNNFTNFGTKDGLRSDAVYSMVQDNDGLLWFGTLNGISRYDGSNFTHFTNEKGLPFYSTHALVKDKSENILIGSQEGLFRFDGKTLTCLTKNDVSSVAEDELGNLWMSHVKPNVSGMFLSKYNGKSLTQIISKTQVFGLIADKAGHIWFGTEAGAFRFDGQSFINFKTL